MSVYVDDLRTYPTEAIQPAARRYGNTWCHLTCGGDCDELHAFAARIGMRPAWAQHMDRADHYYHHYDLTPARRARAVKAGAEYKSNRDQAAEHIARDNARRAEWIAVVDEELAKPEVLAALQHLGDA